jgi:hypothetical protein
MKIQWARSEIHDPMVNKEWGGDIMMWHEREIVEEKKGKERTGHRDSIFNTHLVSLKKSRQDDSNHTKKDHQTRS